MLSKLKIVLSFLMLIGFAHALQAENGNDSLLFIPQKHIVKTRVIYPIIDLIFISKETNKMLGFSYENIISKRRTLNISMDLSIIYTNTNGFTGFSKSSGVSLYPEYRFYPFNKKKMYPRGFYIGPSLAFGVYSGWNEIYKSSSTYTGNSIVTGYTLVKHSKFNVVTIGAGPAFGWQYFMGKRKRFTMSHSFGFYMNKNNILYESAPISDVYRIYPEKVLSYSYYIATHLGYSFIKSGNKKDDYFKKR